MCNWGQTPFARLACAKGVCPQLHIVKKINPFSLCVSEKAVSLRAETPMT